jgi:hydroxyacylglutathione hydrolase
MAKHMPASKLAGLIDSGDPPLLLDVRSRWEYNYSHIPGAMHMPFWKSFTAVYNLSRSRDAMVVVYCEHGPRAGVAKLALLLAGFSRVLYLDGHMQAWRKAGLPTDPRR